MIVSILSVLFSVTPVPLLHFHSHAQRPRCCTQPYNTKMQKMLIPGERDVPVAVTLEPELTLGELDQTEVWNERRSNGESSGFDDSPFKFSSWLSGLPGDAERFLEESANMGQSIMWATLAARDTIVARGVAIA